MAPPAVALLSWFREGAGTQSSPLPAGGTVHWDLMCLPAAIRKQMVPSAACPALPHPSSEVKAVSMPSPPMSPHQPLICSSWWTEKRGQGFLQSSLVTAVSSGLRTRWSPILVVCTASSVAAHRHPPQWRPRAPELQLLSALSRWLILN